jgi:hypothetical protein
MWHRWLMSACAVLFACGCAGTASSVDRRPAAPSGNEGDVATHAGAVSSPNALESGTDSSVEEPDSSSSSCCPPDPAGVEAILERFCDAGGGCVGRAAVGDAVVDLTIQGSSGRVTRVNVAGDFSGPTATCLANLIRAVEFPAFCELTFTIHHTCRFPRPAPTEPGPIVADEATGR